MSIFDEETKKWYCECGCGEEINFWATWTKGHYTRTEECREKTSKLQVGRVKFLDEEYVKTASEANRQAYVDDPTLADRTSEAKLGLCFLLDEGHHEMMSEAHKQAYIDDPTLADRVGETHSGLCYLLDEGNYERRSEGQKQRWKDPEGHERHSEVMAGTVHSNEYSKQCSERQKRMWEDPEYREAHSGENSPHWKGGFTGGYGYGWGAIREFILVRDGYTCQGCGSKFSLDVHHIDGYTFNVNERNLVTVCHSCNLKAASRYEEEYWKQYYAERIEEIYSGEQMRIPVEDL